MVSRFGLWRLWLAVASMTTLLAGPSPARASQALGLSLEQLVQQSEATVLGHTLSLRSFWQGPRIVTVSKVAVDELWAGSLSGRNTLDIVTLGGVVGDYGQRVDGAGEVPGYGRVVLHVSKVSADEYAPLGMAEGIWQVEGLWGDGSRVLRHVPHAPSGAISRPSVFFSAMPHDTLGALRAAVAAARTPKGSR